MDQSGCVRDCLPTLSAPAWGQRPLRGAALWDGTGHRRQGLQSYQTKVTRENYLLICVANAETSRDRLPGLQQSPRKSQTEPHSSAVFTKLP